MNKPNPAITADLLSHLPAKKAETQAQGQAPTMKKEHAPGPKLPKANARTAEKSSAVQGHTRSSNRGK